MSLQEEASGSTEQGLLGQMPTILRLLSSALNDGHMHSVVCQSDMAGSPSGAAGNAPHLPGQVAEEAR